MGDGIFGQVLGLTVGFTCWLLLAVFLIALASEFGIMVPYLMESVWLFSGYNVAIGTIAPGSLIILCLVGLLGRQVGSAALFHISWLASTPLGILYRNNIKPRLSERFPANNSFQRISCLLKSLAKRLKLHPSHSVSSNVGENDSIRLLGRTFRLSPLTVALGRCFWLRLPITIAMGATRQRASLLLGVAIFSVIWDGAYIALGVLGGKGGLDTVQMLLYPLGVMIIVSTSVFGFRRLHRFVTVR